MKQLYLHLAFFALGLALTRFFENVISPGVSLPLLWAVYLFVQYFRHRPEPSAADAKPKTPDMYCFDCEIEMPTKIVDGELCCKNCGLRHNRKYKPNEELISEERSVIRKLIDKTSSNPDENHRDGGTQLK